MQDGITFNPCSTVEEDKHDYLMIFHTLTCVLNPGEK